MFRNAVTRLHQNWSLQVEEDRVINDVKQHEGTKVLIGGVDAYVLWGITKLVGKIIDELLKLTLELRVMRLWIPDVS